MDLNLEKLVLGILFALRSGYGQDFGYDGNTGPAFWGVKYHGCNGGKLQSPIDIEFNNVTEKQFPPLIFQHFNEPLETVKLENNGHTALLSIKQGKIPSIRGGPLNGMYNFSQLHFHWGRSDEEGSENLINNQSFPLELHMVLFNTGYGNFTSALDHDDGLTVLAFLFHKTIKKNQQYQKFERELPAVEHFNATIDIVGFVSLDNFTTTDRTEYFTYQGSLTTPPCSEVVTWIEFINTIPLSHEQIQEFRFLSGAKGKLNHNFRPAQATNDRKIYMSIPNPPTSTSSEHSSNIPSISNAQTSSKTHKSSSTCLTSSSVEIVPFVLLMFKYFSYAVN